MASGNLRQFQCRGTRRFEILHIQGIGEVKRVVLSVNIVRSSGPSH
jgi:hypothetical protein